MEDHTGALCGPGRNGITSTHMALARTQSHAPKSLGKVPERSAGGFPRAWLPGVFIAGETAVSPSQPPSTSSGYPGTGTGSVRMCRAHASLSLLLL